MNFYKYQGTGNDFVMVDNREGTFPKGDTELIAHLRHRRSGIGADGLILLENDPAYDFRMVYYNADGRESTTCGNGGRCVVVFAREIGVTTGNSTRFIAIDGEHHVTIDAQNKVHLQMKDVQTIDAHPDYAFLDTGPSHHVQWVADVDKVDVKTEGAVLRYGDFYADKGGSNINFVSPTADGFAVRTYERGVEDETYFCGIGVTAVAIALYHTAQITTSAATLHTKGGDLKVTFEKQGALYQQVYLSGLAEKVFKISEVLGVSC